MSAVTLDFANARASAEPGYSEPATVTLADAAKRIGMPKSTAHQLAAAGKFPCKVIRAGRRYYVVTSSLERLLADDAA